jgi:hypothetical protein
MFARVARFEGGDPEAVRSGAEQINASDGPPPGIPSKGITMLYDPETGVNLTVALFETEEDLRQGDEALNEMNPTANAGTRTSVETFEMLVDRRL